MSPSRLSLAQTPTPKGWGVHKIRARRHFRAELLTYYAVPLRPVTDAVSDGSSAQRLELVVENCRAKDPKLRYFFVVQAVGGDHYASGPIPPGDGVTRWSPPMWFERDTEYRWSVHVAGSRSDESDAGSIMYPVSSASFRIRSEKPAPDADGQ